jgi:hypothetical protein
MKRFRFMTLPVVAAAVLLSTSACGLLPPQYSLELEVTGQAGQTATIEYMLPGAKGTKSVTNAALPWRTKESTGFGAAWVAIRSASPGEVACRVIVDGAESSAKHGSPESDVACDVFLKDDD